MRTLFAGLVIAATFGPSAAADDKPLPKLSGTWVKKLDEAELRFQFLSDDDLKIHVKVGENSLAVVSSYTRDTNGVVAIEVTGHEETGTFPGKPAKGSKYRFKFTIDGKTATLSDFTGDNVEEGTKAVVEGEYKKVEPK